LFKSAKDLFVAATMAILSYWGIAAPDRLPIEADHDATKVE
jgi:hypothetical protein